MKPKAEFVNTTKEFKWRIVYGDEVSPWSVYYRGILVHQFKDGRIFGLATAYWAGTLPVEKVFEIKLLDKE